MEKALFAAGCFWGVELNFSKVDGVVETCVGYAGGDVNDPTYEQVCGKTTGHAEAIEITFDPDVVCYEELLDNFWQFHDPTTPNQQGPDIGSQYRSVIFYLDNRQQALAEKSILKTNAAGRFGNPIVTEVTAATKFWPAEEHHQKYLQKKGITIACV